MSGGGGADLVVGVMLAATEFGLRIALPLLGVVFLETIAMGFVAKTVPQLNVLSLGFPIRILVGLIVIIAALPVTLSVSESFTNEVVDTIIAWSTTSAGPGGGA